MKCQTCRFFEDVDIIMLCHRHPPIWTETGFRWAEIPPPGYGWCGEYESAAPQEKEPMMRRCCFPCPDPVWRERDARY